MKNYNFYEKLESMQGTEHIENFLVYHTALVIAKVKPAVTITLGKRKIERINAWNKCGRKFLKSIDLKCIELRETENSIILLVYDEDLLEKEINTRDHIEFLKSLGYSEEIKINEYVKFLKIRYEKYHCPHELGVFLGIPIEDVRDFMKCTDKKCLLCGYWKVYNNKDDAEKIFTKYDKIKDFTMKSMLNGSLSRDLILSIKNFFHTI
ncbi:DUF3793 family protein [Clostridium sp. SM-530-WT-3G]|uniref:DUF3793 family protein n=1 Tax=Clostridium sp. SM-530-WT-3G TaxID=2725303 RepID=UPI00145D686A|nr:DUF3793 family protein [Clostridium sp. SM-530-WT-3G]NME84099.1 DUF3793 family protein [Clostridium sp. SM-530-WT-3G]